MFQNPSRCPQSFRSFRASTHPERRRLSGVAVVAVSACVRVRKRYAAITTRRRSAWPLSGHRRCYSCCSCFRDLLSPPPWNQVNCLPKDFSIMWLYAANRFSLFLMLRVCFSFLSFIINKKIDKANFLRRFINGVMLQIKIYC